MKKCVCGHEMTKAEWKNQYVCHRCGRTKLIYEITKAKLGIACIVCYEPVELTPNEEVALNYGRPIGSKVCDKCKQAILHIRKQIEQENEHES